MQLNFIYNKAYPESILTLFQQAGFKQCSTSLRLEEDATLNKSKSIFSTDAIDLTWQET